MADTAMSLTPQERHGLVAAVFMFIKLWAVAEASTRLPSERCWAPCCLRSPPSSRRRTRLRPVTWMRWTPTTCRTTWLRRCAGLTPLTGGPDR